MVCTTIKNGTECPFMTSKGCTYNNGTCQQIIDKCDGCNRTIEMSTGWYCASCPEPSIKWKTGNCNLATHVVTAPAKTKAKLNPIKASKRMG